MEADETALQKCLFFTANRLSNVLRRMANEAYAGTGVATPHVYLLIVVYRHAGITITELSEKLDIAPSTCTRFVNSLVEQGLLRREAEWKNVHVYLTDEGMAATGKIDSALRRLAESCFAALGADTCASLADEMRRAADILSKK